MPTYEIKGPDGSTYEVNAPDGASEADVLAYAQKNFKAPAPKAPEERTKMASFKQGLGDAGIGMYLGAKQLFSTLDEDERGVLNEMEKDTKADPNPWSRGGGKVAGQLAATVVPASHLSKAMAARVALANASVPATTALGRTAQAVAGSQAVNAGAVSGLQTGLLEPIKDAATYGEGLVGKGKEAAKSALAGALTTLGVQGATKMVTRPFTPTHEAEELMRQGINPTLQQGAESRAGKYIGGLTSGAVPVRGRQNKEVRDAVARRIMPGQDVESLNTPDLIRAAQATIDQDYARILGGKTYTVSNANRTAMNNVVNRLNIRADARQSAFQSLDAVFPPGTNTLRMGPAKMQEYRQVLQDQIDAMGGDDVVSKQAKQALIAVKNQFDTSVRNTRLSADELTALRDVDARHFDFTRMAEAADTVRGQQSLGLNDLMGAYKKMAHGRSFATEASRTQDQILGPATRTMGLTPNQDMVRTALIAATKATAGVAANTVAPGVAAPLYGVSLLGQTGRGARALFGHTDTQRALAEMVRNAAPYAANVGALETAP